MLEIKSNPGFQYIQLNQIVISKQNSFSIHPTPWYVPKKKDIIPLLSHHFLAAVLLKSICFKCLLFLIALIMELLKNKLKSL